MADAAESRERKKIGDPDRLSERIRQMHAAPDPSSICRLLHDTLKDATGVERVAVCTYDVPRGSYRAEIGSPELIPEPAVLEFVEQEGKLATVPHAAGGIVTVIPMIVNGQKAGLVVMDVTPVAEEMAESDTGPIEDFVQESASILLKLQVAVDSQEQAALLKNILDSITNGIMTLDTKRRISRLNHNAMAMLELGSEDIGKPTKEVLQDELADAIESMRGEITANGFAMEKMVQRRFSNGLLLPMAISMTILQDEEYRELGLVLVFRDMTATRELERLRRLDEMKSEFVSNVSHELKTPLTSIKAYTEALTDMIEDEEPKHFLGVIEEESDRLLFLINDLLNVSRIQSGKMKMNFALINPQDIVTEVMKISKVQSEKHEIVTELDGDLPDMMLDKEKMKEVSINLLSNAVKYSPGGGKVWVRQYAKEGNLVMEVEDQGMGMSKEDADKVFESFFRVDSSMTAEIGGTGLGLSIVKAIVENHGGKVWVETEPGKGSKFCFMVPIRKEMKPSEQMETMG